MTNAHEADRNSTTCTAVLSWQGGVIETSADLRQRPVRRQRLCRGNPLGWWLDN